MFSYSNKVVGIEIRNQNVSSGLYDILLNNAYVGSSTGSGIGDGAYLIGSNNNSLAFPITGGVPLPTYYFSDLLLNTGINELSFVGPSVESGLITSEIDLYQISGSTLIKYNTPGWGGATSISSRPKLDWSIFYGPGADEEEDPVSITNDGFEISIIQGAPSYYGLREQELSVETFVTLLPEESVTFDYVITTVVTGDGYNVSNLQIDNVFVGGIDDSESSSFESGYSYTNVSETPYELSIRLYTELTNDTATNFNINNFQTTAPSNFYLNYPTGRSVPLFEIYPVFNVETGNLDQVFTGSGVHLKKDVTLFFDILDQQLNAVSSNQQFLENPLISGCVFDILNANGTIASENFFTGKYSRSLAFSALDNENVFGSYQKDFGVRCKLPNTFDGSIFTGEFYVYGNVPNILDIVPDYTEFSGAAQATELINAAIVLQNDLNFTQMDRYDVYALTGSGSAVNELTYLNPFAQEGYLFSQSAADVVNARSLTINRGTLPQDVPHYFTVVPYGTLGSGSSFTFGPATFVTVENIIVFSETNSSASNLYDGNSFGQTVYKTGRFLSNTGILHQFSSGQFTSVKYFIEVSGSGQRRLSELKGVVNTTGFDLTKESVNDTTTQYQLTGFSSGQCGLFASGSGYADYSYKLQATMI
jgi:hypothetical protein